MWPQEMKITRIGVAIFVKYRELKPSQDGKPNPDSSVLNVTLFFVSERGGVRGIASICIMKC